MSDAWSQIKAAYGDLIEAAKREETSLAPAWRRFAEIVRSNEAAPPHHLVTLLGALRRIEKPRAAVRILDHGCGGGLTLLYLLAIGYPRIHGVDLGGNTTELNRIARAAGLETAPFAVYDGQRLPYPASSFDFIFSQQVLEHVAPAAIESYYAEEARVLAPGGIVYHQVPHRLVPYESHTRTWLVHYLPWRAALRIYRALGRDSLVAREHLFLRSPGFHRRRLRRYFGNCEDLTEARLRGLRIEGHYDGPLGVRRLLTGLMTAPVLGAVLGPLARNLVMLDTISVKRAPGSRAGSLAGGGSS